MSNQTADDGNGFPEKIDVETLLRDIKAGLTARHGLPSLGAIFNSLAIMGHAHDRWLGNVFDTLQAQFRRIEELEARVHELESGARKFDDGGARS